MLDELDKELEHRGHKFARYADDFIILVRSKRAGLRVLASVTRFIEHRLKLKVNTLKSRVGHVRDSKFLGFGFMGNRIIVHPKSLKQFKYNVRQKTSRTWGVSMARKITAPVRYLRGWMNYFNVGMGFQQSLDFDHWIRRRLRMCYWKQWRKPRTKVRNLMKRGVGEHLAICCGISSKSYWRNAKTQGTHIALSLEYLRSQGLISLRDLWVAYHYPNG